MIMDEFLVSVGYPFLGSNIGQMLLAYIVALQNLSLPNKGRPHSTLFLSLWNSQQDETRSGRSV